MRRKVTDKERVLRLQIGMMTLVVICLLSGVSLLLKYYGVI